MAELTRKSLVAVVKETTAGTLVAPSSGSNFITVREGYSVTSAQDTLDNDELSPSVGSKAPVLSFERPESELPIYLRHSGTEAVRPKWDVLLEGAIGSVTAAPVQSVTDAGSTAGTATVAGIVKVTAGGSNYPRGAALLVKDGTNGRNIRNVSLQTSNDLTLNFNLSAAPAAGIGVGRPIFFAPSDTPPSYSIWDYRGNRGAVQAQAGMKVSEFAFSAESAGFLESTASYQGTSFYYNPIILAATDTKLDFNETGPTLRAATIAAGAYKDPHALAEAIQTAMNDVATDAITVTYSDTTGKFTIASAGALLELLWNTGANAANTNGDKIGFSTAADDTGAVTYTSDNAMDLTAPFTPVADANTDPIVVKNAEFTMGSFGDFGCAGIRSIDATVSNTLGDVPDFCEVSGLAEKLLSKRKVSIEVVLNERQYDVSKFKSFRAGSDVALMFNAGVKSGGQWVEGRNFNFYVPQAKISEYNLDDADGVVVINMTIIPYVTAAGLAEIYANLI